MASAKPVRRLIVNADDFGASSSINHAVIQAHSNGILTTASLMVNGDAAEEAITLAREYPSLGVGLHLSLCFGKSTLHPSSIPTLVDSTGEFSRSPVLAGMKYFFSPTAREQLALEIEAQFAKFHATGLPMDHLNGHLHFHLHPAIFSILTPLLSPYGVKAMRLTYDPGLVDLPLGTGRWFYRLSHAFIFRFLAKRARPLLLNRGIAHTDFVFGLLENARVDEDYIVRLMRVLPGGDSELYSHPSLHEFRHEFDALVSPRVRSVISDENIKLIRYQDLWSN
jgi:hopanoid biosynthesis associated protein HpnK